MVLDQVGILEFIHHDITTEVLIEAQALGETFEKNRYKEEEISEIESVISTEIALIALINLGHLLFKDVELRRNILLRSDPLVLQMVDGGSNLSRMKHLGVEVQLVDDGLEVPVLILLIIDDKILLKTRRSIYAGVIREQAEWKVETQILTDPPRSFTFPASNGRLIGKRRQRYATGEPFFPDEIILEEDLVLLLPLAKTRRGPSAPDGLLGLSWIVARDG
jgi:hypothetical protein